MNIIKFFKIDLKNLNGTCSNIILKMETIKIVINAMYGGFTLSEESVCLLGGRDEYDFINDRSNPELIHVVEQLGNGASTSKLKIVEIPRDLVNYYRIIDNDGMERIEYRLAEWLDSEIKKISEENINEWKNHVGEITNFLITHKH